VRKWREEYIDSPRGEYLSWEKQNMDNNWREMCAQIGVPLPHTIGDAKMSLFSKGSDLGER